MKSAEQKVLLNILKGNDPSHLEGINTGELFRLFHRHRLFNLASGIIQLLDEKEKEKWVQARQALTVRSLHFTFVLSKILHSFKENGIEVIPIKGPVLLETLYNNTGQRHFRDLDLLVRREDIGASLEIMKESGYELLSPKRELTDKQWKYYYQYKYDIGLINRELGIVIELHTGFYYPRLFNVSREDILFGDLVGIDLSGIPVKCMNNENTFLYLTIHGGHHLYFRLFWLRDVAEAINRWTLDHNKILSNAKQLKVERLLGVSLELASELCGVDIPLEYKPYLVNEARIMAKLKRICTQAILGSEFPSFWGRMEKLHFYILLRTGLKYKWAVLSSLFHRWYIRKFLESH